MEIIQNIFAAILPPLYIVYYIYKNDLYEKEPRKVLIKSFFLGCLTVIPAVILESIFDENFFNNIFLFSIIGVGLVEESSKFAFLRLYNYKKDDFNEPYDGIVYAVTISMGFALVENLFYVLGNHGQEISVAILRMFTAIPLHATCGVIMGYFFGISKMRKENKLNPLFLGLLFPTIIHGLYDYFIFAGFSLIFSLLILIIAFIYSNKAIKLHQKNSPFKTDK
tara:strand:- start:1544 stop:2212 length:669 start_codon:yes stop_codon:yes gene_type:complete